MYCEEVSLQSPFISLIFDKSGFAVQHPLINHTILLFFPEILHFQPLKRRGFTQSGSDILQT